MNKAATGILGAVAGGLVGWVMRPSAPLVGQLPFDAVISRGRSLRGFDQILMPLAQESFNYLLTGVLVGALVGVVAGHLIASSKRGGPA